MSKIWRYVQFTKFLSILEEQGLYFPNTVSFDDPFEGSVPRPHFDQRLREIEKEFDSPEPFKAKFEEILSKFSRTNDPKSFVDVQVGHKIVLRNKLRAKSADEFEAKTKWIDHHNFDRLLHYWHREITFISCWYQSEFESAAMWRLYADGKDTVCIQTTRDNLISQLPNNVETRAVQYIDFDKDEIPELRNTPGKVSNLYFYKRRSFEHEKEIRALFISSEHAPKNFAMEYGMELRKLGKWVPVDLTNLIEAIYVSPACPDWYYQLVRKVVSKYQLQCDVRRSSLEKDPVH